MKPRFALFVTAVVNRAGGDQGRELLHEMDCRVERDDRSPLGLRSGKPAVQVRSIALVLRLVL